MKQSRLHSLSVTSLSLILASGLVACKKPEKPLTHLQSPKTQVGMTGNNTRPLPDSGTLTANPPIATPQNPGGGIEQTRPHNLADLPKDREALKAQTIYFDYDKFGVKPSEKSKLDAVAAYLKSNNTSQLLIEGHCDERGTEGYNLSLGDRRALSAREYLVTSGGVSADRVHTMSYGEAKPAVDGHDETAWSKNRRGDFVVLGVAQ